MTACASGAVAPRSWRGNRARRRGPARSPSRCAPGRAPPRSVPGTARTRWRRDCARGAAGSGQRAGPWPSRSTPRSCWPDLTPAPRSSRSTPLWPVLVAAPTGQAGVRRRPRSSGRRPPSRGEHPSPLQCAGATIPVAPARSPARVSRHSRRWPSRRRARSPPPTSTSRRPAPRWPVFRCRSMAGFGCRPRFRSALNVVIPAHINGPASAPSRPSGSSATASCRASMYWA